MDLKRTVKLAKHRGWRYFLTCDESWFYVIIDHEQIWTRAEVASRAIPRKMIGSPKRMVAIFWSPLGFCVVRVLAKWAHFDATYFRDNILNDIDCTRCTGSEEDGRRKLVLHFENARPHTPGSIIAYCRERRTTRAPHPAFSPDLAASDFSPF
jgi:histone-lysine N-methyltransferase SETMAR